MRNTAEALGHEPMGRLMLRMTAPAIVALLVQALYNVVDAIFVGHGVGTLGIAGISDAFPLFIVVIGIGQLVGIGSASIISRALGRRDVDTAGRSCLPCFRRRRRRTSSWSANAREGRSKTHRLPTGAKRFVPPSVLEVRRSRIRVWNEIFSL